MKTTVKNLLRYKNRRGATVVYMAMMLVLLFGMAAFAIEVGMMMVARTNLQSAADSAALAGASVLAKGKTETMVMAKQYAAYHHYMGEPVQLADEDIQVGFWDPDAVIFTEDVNGNAVRVITRINNSRLVFGALLGTSEFSAAASSVAVAPARDIVFVVDLSGSMNDDTEPVWATKTVNDVYASTAYAGVGNKLMQGLFDDFGYGVYPGTLNTIGSTLGVADDNYCYANLTSDQGPLANPSMSADYRILPTDDEATRKLKCYGYLIDYEIAPAMSNVKPTPDSTVTYDYWAKYLDYIILSVWIHTPIPLNPDDDGGDPPVYEEPPPIGQVNPKPSLLKSSPFRLAAFATPVAPVPDEIPGTTPVDRGWIPPMKEWEDRIYKFNNPNENAFASPDYQSRWDYGNKIGFLTYVNFMQDWGREEKPDGIHYVPLSVHSPYCPQNNETTDGGDFAFPPATQPMHACRRSLISAFDVIKKRNEFSNPDHKDHVAIITFDRLDTGTVLLQPLTKDYDAAMLACTQMQATIDKGQSTATEIGLSAAKDYVKQIRDGGQGRNNVNKVVVLLTDGLPNAYSSDDADIKDYQSSHPSSNYFANGKMYLDAPLMHTNIMSRKGWQVHPVGIGFGTNYDFMDRMARLGGTSQGGESLRGSGNPALYEERLRELFASIVEDPMVNLAQ